MSELVVGFSNVPFLTVDTRQAGRYQRQAPVFLGETLAGCVMRVKSSGKRHGEQTPFCKNSHNLISIYRISIRLGSAKNQAERTKQGSQYQCLKEA